jgi:NAD(P)-dependent dehydrogenase (short-subunit alcohol dehydrogenase family)
MGELQGRIAVITGAGRGLGRQHALLFAREGAKVVVNDLGGSSAGDGADAGPAEQVAAAIRVEGGEAIANTDDITTADGAQLLIDTAVEAYGDLHVLVNNAGILRDRSLVNTTDEEWDSVINVHLRGHFCPTRAAAALWRDRSKAGATDDRSLINTTSTSGLLGNFGQGSYGSAKAGIAAMTTIAQLELERYGVRANAIAPAARTRLTRPDLDEDAPVAAPADEFDDGDPANVSPIVAYLATATCPMRGQVWFTHGRTVRLMQPWTMLDPIRAEGRWTIDGLRQALAPHAHTRFPTVAEVFGTGG